MQNFQGRWPEAKPPMTFEHEMVGIIEQVGSGITTLNLVIECVFMTACSAAFVQIV